MRQRLSQNANRVLAAIARSFALPASDIKKATGFSREDITKLISQLCLSEHLLSERYGAHSYYRLAKKARDRDFRQAQSTLLPIEKSDLDSSWKKARVCYSHFAGQFGVRLLEHFEGKGWLKKDENEFSLTDLGKKKFDVDLPKQKLCLDCSERQFHMADEFGKRIQQGFFEKGWVQRRRVGDRSIVVTEEGAQKMLETLEFDAQSFRA